MYLEVFTCTWHLLQEMSEVMRDRFMAEDFRLQSNRDTYRQIKAIREFSRCAFDVTSFSTDELRNFAVSFAEMSFCFAYSAKYENEGTYSLFAYVSMGLSKQIIEESGLILDTDSSSALDLAEDLYREGYLEHVDEDGFVF